jgi:nucleoside-diphosphate-sugar epimerase
MYIRALITGASGFIGSNLVERLLAEGAQVKCLIRPSSNLTWLSSRRVELIPVDYHDPASLAAVVQDVDAVFHLAGATRAVRRAEFFRANLEVTCNLLQACQEYGPKNQKILFVSSLAAAGPSSGTPLTEDEKPQPVSAYGASKLAAERAVLAFGQKRPVIIIRPPVVYGPHDRDTLMLFKSVQRRLHVIPGRGTQKVSLVHVDDLVTGILLAVRSEQAHSQVYYICGEGHYDWQTVGDCLGRVLGRRFGTIYVPWSIMRVVALGGSLVSHLTRNPALLSLDKLRDIRQANWLCSSEKAKAELGFQPVIDLFAGLASTAAWYKEKGWL